MIKTHKLRMIYINFMNAPESITDFAHRLKISPKEANHLIGAGAIAHNNILEVERDGRYKVVYMFMGKGMHNYQVRFDDDLVGYARNEDEGWAVASEHYIKRISDGVNYYELMDD